MLPTRSEAPSLVYVRAGVWQEGKTRSPQDPRLRQSKPCGGPRQRRVPLRRMSSEGA